VRVRAGVNTGARWPLNCVCEEEVYGNADSLHDYSAQRARWIAAGHLRTTWAVAQPAYLSATDAAATRYLGWSAAARANAADLLSPATAHAATGYLGRGIAAHAAPPHPLSSPPPAGRSGRPGHT